ncbi:conserved hypothetical protein, partial [Ricinus communis]
MSVKEYHGWHLEISITVVEWREKKRMRQEEMFWHHKSILNWLKYGDQNSKFFHLSMIQWRQYNQISRIKSKQGRWIKGNKKIKR